MDKNMIYRDLADSADENKRFAKVITPFSDADCRDYIKTLKELETDGKITLEECRLEETVWDKIVVANGLIN